MKEVEVKILNVDRPKIEDRLIALGARKYFDDEIKAKAFDFEDEKIKKDKSLIRLRLEGTKAVLTFKKKLSAKESKICEELQVDVSNFEEMKSILEQLGLKETGSLVKHRISYVLNNVKFEFDKFKEENDFVPEFLEIEANDEETLFKYVELMGFTKDDCKPWGGKKVINYYKNK